MVTEGNVMQFQNLKDLLVVFRDDLSDYHQTGEFTSAFYDALFQYYSSRGAINYGLATARSGDPVSWVSRQLAQDIKVLHSQVNKQQ
jgi:hypothetical protein